MVFGEDYGPDVDPRRWVVIYPPYIDKLRKESEVCHSNSHFGFCATWRENV